MVKFIALVFTLLFVAYGVNDNSVVLLNAALASLLVVLAVMAAETIREANRPCPVRRNAQSK